MSLDYVVSAGDMTPSEVREKISEVLVLPDPPIERAAAQKILDIKEERLSERVKFINRKLILEIFALIETIPPVLGSEMYLLLEKMKGNDVKQIFSDIIAACKENKDDSTSCEVHDWGYSDIEFLDSVEAKRVKYGIDTDRANRNRNGEDGYLLKVIQSLFQIDSSEIRDKVIGDSMSILKLRNHFDFTQ